MKGLKIAIVVIGVLLIVLGIVCMFGPWSGITLLAWIAGVAMLVEGITSIISWNRLRKEGNTNGWFLLSAVISIVLGLILVGCNIGTVVVEMFLVIMAAIWLLAMGVLRIVSAVNLRRSNQITNGAVGGKWLITMIVGIIMAIVGVIGVFSPWIMALAIGICLGVFLIVAGINVLTIGLEMSKDDRDGQPIDVEPVRTVHWRTK